MNVEVEIVFNRACAIEARRLIVADIVTKWRERQVWVQSDVALILRAKSLCRAYFAGDKELATKAYERVSESIHLREDRLEYDVAVERAQKAGLKPPRKKTFAEPEVFEPNSIEGRILRDIEPIEMSRRPLMSALKAIEANLNELSMNLPGVSLCEATKGVGTRGTTLAAIVGSAGDLASYQSPSSLWKRMGLAVIDGERQRRVKDAEDALIHGYNPERRAVMFNVGASMMRAGGSREIYDARKAKYLTECQERASSKGETISKKTGKPTKYSPAMHSNNMARRYLEKDFLKHLWRAWEAESQNGRMQLPETVTTPLETKSKLVLEICRAIGQAGMTKAEAATFLEEPRAIFYRALRGNFFEVDVDTLQGWLNKLRAQEIAA